MLDQSCRKPTSAALLSRAGQEILTNTFRHSRASEVTVRLEAVDHGIRLTITTKASASTGTGCA
ncbi:hypothetical protein NFC73_00065 [Pseudarthrobacter sp. RMG13]|uniref:Uncharacterized protein n=1 Tax=Pseudarthrobacter humi TaxID=2952523 RepID=A0ABT1LI38_9MICC|nr:hypothetical protein [Pseudarthrobacter humi]MCP8998135.1 hypothetical protein [Pseudarthrobacter humi]